VAGKVAIWSSALFELLYPFKKRGSRQRPLASFAPQRHGLLDQTGLGAVACKQLGLVVGYLRELAIKCLGDTSV
jgi:hypothetical protein